MNDGLRKLALAIGALALVLLLSACSIDVGVDIGDRGPKGSGVAATSKRRTAAFDRVELRGAADVTIAVGKARSVSVRGDDNLLGRVKTRVEGDTLVISTRPYRSKIGIEVEVNVPALKEVELSGSGEMDVSNVNAATFSAALSGSGELWLEGRADRLVLDLSGSGDAQLDNIAAQDMRLSIGGSGEIVATGTTRSLQVEIPGSGEADLNGLTASHARASVSGSGDISLVATESLDASVSGSGDISYAGNPRTVTKNVGGSGSIDAS
jgi:hypothetical protein